MLDTADGAGTINFASQARSHATGPEYHQYELKLELYSEIDSEESQISITDRRVLLVIAKKDASTSEYWPRLLKSKDKVSNVKVDWTKWVDEDDEEEEETKDDFDLGDLQNMSKFNTGAGGGLGALGGAAGGASGLDDEDDSDDEDLPELEAAGPSSS